MPKIVDHQKYREELLLKCFDLFASRGYANVTMREIAQELNVSTGSLYHYFSNKQTILQKMIEVIALREIEQVSYFAYQSDELEKRVDMFFNYFREREEFFKRVLLLLLDFSKYCTSADNQKFLNEYADVIFDKIAEGVGASKPFGAFVLIFLAGLAYHRLIVPDVVSFDEQADFAKGMVMPFIKETFKDTRKQKTGGARG